VCKKLPRVGHETAGDVKKVKRSVSSAQEAAEWGMASRVVGEGEAAEGVIICEAITLMRKKLQSAQDCW